MAQELADLLLRTPSSPVAQKMLSDLTPLPPLAPLLKRVQHASIEEVISILKTDSRPELKEAVFLRPRRSVKLLSFLITSLAENSEEDFSFAARAIMLLPLEKSVLLCKEIRPFLKKEASLHLEKEIARKLQREKDPAQSFLRIKDQLSFSLTEYCLDLLVSHVRAEDFVDLIQYVPLEKQLFLWHQLFFSSFKINKKEALLFLSALEGCSSASEANAYVILQSSCVLSKEAALLLASSSLYEANLLSLKYSLPLEKIKELLHKSPDLLSHLVPSLNRFPSLRPLFLYRLKLLGPTLPAQNAFADYIGALRWAKADRHPDFLKENFEEALAATCLLRSWNFPLESTWLLEDMIDLLSSCWENSPPKELADVFSIKEAKLVLEKVLAQVHFYSTEKSNLEFVLALFARSPASVSLWLDSKNRDDDLFDLLGVQVKLLLEKSFGLDLKLWEIALGLLEGFMGSFQELVLTTKALAI